MGASWSSPRGAAPQFSPFRERQILTPEEILQEYALFEELKADPKCSEFFKFTFPGMKVGRKIGEGASWTEVYEGEFTLMQKRFPCLLKVFDFFSLRALFSRFPEGMLTGGNSVFPGYSSGTSSILGGLVLEDGEFAGKFAIVTRREWGDLRSLIDLRMRKRKLFPGSLFGDECAKRMMLEIATGMRQLHSHGVLHEDLKSPHVLVCTGSSSSLGTEDIEDDGFHLKVNDFEYSPKYGSVFWKAPEFPKTTKSDVYSFAVVCSEILTGCSFDGANSFAKSRSHRFAVARGYRPELPRHLDDWLRDLIERCWHPDPSQRPEFEEVVAVFKSYRTTHDVEQAVEASTPHWSEIGGRDKDALQGESNIEIFESLKHHPEFSNFFSYTFRNLVVGRKIAEGGQAKIFEAEFEKDNGLKVPCVVKLFKHISLRAMVRQWPPGMLRSGESPAHLSFGFMGLFPGATRTCEVLGAMVDEHDNFGFIFNREGGDLRSLIERRMKHPSRPSRPFKPAFAKSVLYEIALGMQHLHDHGILHRDLKASNVLVTNVFGEFPADADEELINIKVADFECSMLADGTNFWRAPEILKQLELGTERTYTREADVYSYGMTCYEVLTGNFPLDYVKNRDYEAVYKRGERPKLPRRIDGWLRTLITRCWHAEIANRPGFKEIVEEFEKYCPKLVK